MIDIGTPLRAAYYSVLNAQILIGGAPVPIVDEKLDVNISEQDIYVLLTTQDEDAEKSNKTTWVNETMLKMQIVNQRRATNTKEIVEDVAGQILNILFPNRTTWNVPIQAPLSLTYARLVSAQYNPIVQTDKGFNISKLLTFKNRITQN